MPLTMVPTGEPNVIKKIGGKEETRRFLENLGFVTGGMVTVCLLYTSANLRVSEVLAEKNIKVAKTLVGNYMTSIDMAGYSITLLKLDAELKELVNAPADTPAFVQV